MVEALLCWPPSWQGALVLTYHRIARRSDDVLDPGVWSATPEAFDAQVSWLSRSFDVIGPEQLEGCIRGRGRYVLLTFDDGYHDNWEFAYPILRSHGVRATFFVTTGFLDRTTAAWWDEIAWMVRNGRHAGWDLAELIGRYKGLSPERRESFLDDLARATGSGRRPQRATDHDWMSWDQVRELRDGGMAVGAHTVSHSILAGLQDQRQRDEIEGSLARIEQELGERPSLFAYPDGQSDSFDVRSLAVLRASEVRHAFLNQGGVVHRRGWDPLLLPRVNVWNGMWPHHFRLLATAPRVFARR